MRCQKIFKEYNEDPLDYATVSLVDDNARKWKVCINGPKNSPYEDGRFMLNIDFPSVFPAHGPDITMITNNKGN